MRRIALLTALALFLAVPATAGAAVRHVVKGAGFGHGIGMSQYGAYGYALEGSNYRGILEHYYSGTTLSSAPGAPVRVLLQPVDPYIRFRGATNANGRGLRPGTTYVARLARSGISAKDELRQARRHLREPRCGWAQAATTRYGCSARRSTPSAMGSTAARSK